MKYLILLFTAAISFPLLSQQTRTLTIIDKDSSAPVSYAIVSNLEKTAGGYSNEKGVFNLAQSEIVNQDSLVILAIGYEDLIIKVSGLSTDHTVSLIPTDLMLSEVVVIASSQEEDQNSEYLGVIQKKTGSLNCCGNKLGCEYAVKMVKSDIKDEIDQIYIYFSKGGANDAPFRIKIYNEKEGRPSKLLHAVLVKPTKKLKKWNAIPISKEYITKDAKIFYVAFEWLNSNEERFYYENIYKNICYGQTLGSTRKSNRINFFFKLFGNDVWRQGGEGIISVPMVKVKMK